MLVTTPPTATITSKEQPPPKAVNIIRPSSPFLQQFKPGHHHLSQHHYESSSTASSSSPSTLSTLSSNSSRPPATVLGPHSFFPLYSYHKGQQQRRLLQRAQSNSNLAQRTAINDENSNSGDDNDSTKDEKKGEDDLDSIDGRDTSSHGSNDNSDGDDEEEEIVSPAKIVARIKHGTIMNGRGEFVNKGNDDDGGWLDEARANRKIADLEIEKTSLLAVNTTLESTVRRQAARIAELEKLLEFGSDAPLTPVSDKTPGENFLSDNLSDEETENDQGFQKIQEMVLNLIDRAEAALVQKTKVSGRVVFQQIDNEVTIQKLAARRSWPVNDMKAHVLQKPAARSRRSWSPNDTKTQIQQQQQQQQQNFAIMNQQHQRPSRRGSTDSVNSMNSSGRPASPRPNIMHTKASMARTLSRSSSPAVMETSPPLTPPPLLSSSPRPYSPPPSTILQRPCPPSRTSSLRRSTHPQETPRWR